MEEIGELLKHKGPPRSYDSESHAGYSLREECGVGE